MSEVHTTRVHRTLLDKMMLWRRAYETRVFDAHREAIGRGPTAEASQEAALSKWVSGEPVEPDEPTE
jgi:hypothetical protein